MQWNRNACNGQASFPISNGNDAVSAEDNACNVLNIMSGSPLADIRYRLTHYCVEMCRLVLLYFLFEHIVAPQCTHWEPWAISLICLTALSVLIVFVSQFMSLHLMQSTTHFGFCLEQVVCAP